MCVIELYIYKKFKLYLNNVKFNIYRLYETKVIYVKTLTKQIICNYNTILSYGNVFIK